MPGWLIPFPAQRQQKKLEVSSNVFPKRVLQHILLSQTAHKASVGGKRLFHFRAHPTKRARNASMPNLAGSVELSIFKTLILKYRIAD